MPQTQEISTITSFSVVGTDITILTAYNSGIQDIISIFIADVAGSLNSVSYVEGELMAYWIDDNGLDMWINSNGEFIISSSDASSYSINANGELIYTY
jgi:hypothetical protein